MNEYVGKLSDEDAAYIQRRKNEETIVEENIIRIKERQKDIKKKEKYYIAKLSKLEEDLELRRQYRKIARNALLREKPEEIA